MNLKLKGNCSSKIVSHVLLESDRPSKMMNIFKKKQVKISITLWVITVLSFLLFSIVILLCHSDSWIIKEGIVYFENEYNFWILRAKNVRNVKFYRSNSITSKITRPSFSQISPEKPLNWCIYPRFWSKKCPNDP